VDTSAAAFSRAATRDFRARVAEQVAERMPSAQVPESDPIQRIRHYIKLDFTIHDVRRGRQSFAGAAQKWLKQLSNGHLRPLASGRHRDAFCSTLLEYGPTDPALSREAFVVLAHATT